MKQELSLITIAGLVMLTTAAALISYTGLATAVLPWLLASTLCWALVVQQTWARLHHNRQDKTSALYADLGTANRMTIVRGWLIAATSGFLFLAAPAPLLIWIAAGLYSIAAILDRLDGWVARKTRRTSLMGTELDTAFDALGLLVAPLLALQLGKIHPSYLLVSIAYYWFVAGLYVRERRGAPVYPLEPSQLRRTLAGFQMGYVAAVLWPAFDARMTVPAGFVFMAPLLAGFFIDWLQVSGRLQMHQQKTRNFFEVLHSATDTVLLPGLRLIATALLLAGVLPAGSMLQAVIWVVAALIMCGIGTRAAALTLIIVAGWTAQPLSGAVQVLMFASIMLLLLGSGGFSLWNGDDEWVNRQDGT